MEEVENQGVKQAFAEEIATPETETAQQETTDSQENQVDDRNDRNWRELNKSKEEWKRKAQMQDELIQRILNQQPQAQPVINQVPEEDIIQELAKEEYVPGEKVAKGFKKLKEDFRREIDEVKKSYASQQQNSLFNDLRREFPDFDEVVNSENLKILEETNPRLANTIAATKDAYAIAIQSYEYIKAKGIGSKEAPSKRVRETEAKIEQNKKTVQTPMDKRPMAQAFSYETMSADQKKALQREMYSNANRVGMGY
jgi:hypothetical protein